MNIKIRNANSQDIPFIYSTMLKSLHTDTHLGKSIRSTTFFKEYRCVIDDILFDSSVLIACDPENAEVIYGYLIYQKPNILHYGYTKEAFRKLHIQTRLINVANLNNPIQITHKTKKANFCQYNFNPFLLYKRSEYGK